MRVTTPFALATFEHSQCIELRHASPASSASDAMGYALSSTLNTFVEPCVVTAAVHASPIVQEMETWSPRTAPPP